MLLEQSFRLTFILIKHTFRDDFIKTIIFLFPSLHCCCRNPLPEVSKVKSEENCALGGKLNYPKFCCAGPKIDLERTVFDLFAQR